MASSEVRELYTVPAAAKELGRPNMTLYRWIGAGKLIAIRLGGILFVPKSEIERLNSINEQADKAEEGEAGK